MRIMVAQIHSLVGNIPANQSKIMQAIDQAKIADVDLVVFPELCLSGYPARDQLFYDSWWREYKKAEQAIIDDARGIHIVFGSCIKENARMYNVARWADRKGQLRTQIKQLLPNQDVFDERRYFSTYPSSQVWTIEEKRFGVHVCEDLWYQHFHLYDHDPVDALGIQGVDVLMNLSCSPYYVHKHQERKKLATHYAKKYNCDFIYVNAVGGNDELIFDGQTFCLNSQGQETSYLPPFVDRVQTIDMSSLVDVPVLDPIEETSGALTRGLKDFIHQAGFAKVVIGLSGGIDSALVTLLAVQALGAENVSLVFMPTEFTRDISHQDAQAIADGLGIDLLELPITDLNNQTQTALSESLQGQPLKDLTQQNIQARLRGLLLMGFSSQLNALVLQTSNKSEMALGYSTLYGDMVGAISPIGDLYKHEVYALCEYLNQTFKAVPQRVFNRAPSAELKADQQDTDSLPPYEVTDALIKRYIEHRQTPEQMIEDGFDSAKVSWIVRQIDTQEFKRHQAPPVLKVKPVSFGMGRRMPIAFQESTTS